MQHPKIVQKTKVLYPQRTKCTNHSRRNNFCNAQQNDCDVLTTVSSAIIERYGSAETKRVIESLNFLAADEEYYKDLFEISCKISNSSADLESWNIILKFTQLNFENVDKEFLTKVVYQFSKIKISGNKK